VNRNLLRQFAKFLAPYKAKIILVLLSLSVISALILSFGTALRILVDKGLSNTEELHRITMYCLLIGIGISLASFLRSYNINSLCERVVSDIRLRAYSSIIFEKPAYFEVRKTSDLISRLTNDTLLISNIIADVFSFALRNCLMALGGLALMFHVSFKLTSIMVAFLAIIIPVVIIFGKKVRTLARITQEKTAILTSDIEETFNAIKTIQAFNSENRKINQFQGLSSNLLAAALKRLKYRSLFFSFVIMVIISSIIMILWIGINDIIVGNITAGELLSFLYFAAQTSVSIGGISDIFSEIQRAFAAMERVFELIKKNDRTCSKYDEVLLTNYDVNFRNIDYSYPTRPQAIILKNFSIYITQGEFIGIVGKSGSGKSTLFQLLLRFFETVNGEIIIGGHNITNMPVSQLRNIFAIVPQEPYIFSATARENILVAKPEASEEELIEAAKLAGIYDYFNSLPEKLDSFLGEKGVRLSGGQKQRIAIARAILRKPQILLLDEATSALDSTNEAKVLESLRNIMKGKTIISIAHRIDTIKDSSKIYVIDEGIIAAAGTHEELLESSELYKKLSYKGFVA
jgi:ATP-binding cassette subfamily B protein